MTAAPFPSDFRKLFTTERIILLIFLIGLAVRLYQLDLKLFHHDEAIHAWFSYRLLTDGIYQYDPVYHGPFLYYVTAAMFGVLGDSDLVGRLVPAVLGALLVPLVYPIYHLGYLDRRQAIIAAFFLALSPSMIYFSRFLRNDIFIAFFTLLLLVSLLLYFERHQTRYALIGALAIGFGMTSKENMPIIVLIFGAYVVYAVWKGLLHLPRWWKRDLVLGIVCVLGIMAILYSSFGQHPEVVATGWIRAIEHWTSMHQQQRLGGPPYFYLLLLLLYEMPILLLALGSIGQFIKGDRPLKLPWKLWKGGNASETTTADLEDMPDPGAGGMQSAPSISCLTQDKNREFTRFCIVWMLLSLGIYAYIGEKVPWLILHQLLPLIFVAVYRMENWKFYLSIASLLFLIGMTWHVAFVPADISEPIVQVQNSEDLREVMAIIDSGDRVAVVTSHYWPLPWYYRGDLGSRITYLGDTPEASYFSSASYDVIIAHDQDSYPQLDGYVKRVFRQNYWFSTYENKDRWLQFYFTRDGAIGSRNWDVFFRDNTAS